MLLSLDIGNTTTTIGLFDEDKLVDTWSIASEKHRSEDELGVLLINLLTFHNYADFVDSACLCSVVECLTERYQNAIKRYLGIKPFVVTNKTTNLLKYSVDYPEEVGADRIDLYTHCLELVVVLSHVKQLCRAYEGEVCRVEEENSPLAFYIFIGYRDKFSVMKCLHLECGQL